MRKIRLLSKGLLFFLPILLDSQTLPFSSATEPVIFQRFLESQTTVEALKSHRKAVWDSSLPVPLKLRYLSRLSAALELQGRFTEALEAVLLQKTLVSSPVLTVRQGHLSLETGNLEEAQAAAHELAGEADPEYRVQGTVLQSRIWRIQGQEEAATKAMREASTDISGLPGVLYLWESSLTSDPVRQQSIALLASRLHEKTPEAQILQDSHNPQIRIWGTRLPLTPQFLPTEPEKSQEFLQVGAYGKKENAEASLGKIPGDLQPKILEHEGFFRVMIPRTPAHEARLIQLKIPFIPKKM